MLERSLRYDREWNRKCMAGPNGLYLTEELTDSMSLKEGMLVLDLGCGRALSSVFMAKEYGVDVYAFDKNVHASETYAMLKDIGMDAHVFPIQAEAAALPVPRGIGDALVCVNAYHSFGMEAGFLETSIKPLLKENAQLGFVVPGKLSKADEESDRDNPVFWTAADWRNWFESEGMEIAVCEPIESAQRAWKEWITVTSPGISDEDVEKTRFNPELTLIKIVGTI